jgi:hypothetical protein
MKDEQGKVAQGERRNLLSKTGRGSKMEPREKLRK